MAANLEIVDGLAQFIFNAEHGDPWHINYFESASVRLDDPNSWGEWVNVTREQRTPLLSTHSLVPVSVQLDNGSVVHIPEQFAVVREADQKVLPGVVGKQFHLGQPIDMLYALRNLVVDFKGEPSTIGLLHDGTTFFASAKVSEFSLDLGDGDKVDHYVNVVSGLTGRRSRGYMVSGIRPVCSNTVSAAWAAASDENSRTVRNTHLTFEQRDQAAQDEMKQILATVLKASERIERMVKTRGSVEDIQAIGKAVFGESKTAQRIVSEIEELYTTAPGQQLSTTQGTLWGVQNGFTYYLDHCSRIGGVRKGTLGNIEESSDSAFGADKIISHRLFGQGAQHRDSVDTCINQLLDDRAPIVAQV